MSQPANLPTPPAPFLPRTRAEMEARGWDALDVLLVTADGYVDHPSFGGAAIGRLLEARGYRVGMLDVPDLDGWDRLPTPRPCPSLESIRTRRKCTYRGTSLVRRKCRHVRCLLHIHQRTRF